jgi:ubiquitin-protein ligase
MALQRLQREIVELQGSHILGVYQHEDDFHLVEVTLEACGKNFTIQFDIPYDYPFCPPDVRFLTPANLKCIDPSSGKVCLVRTTWHGWTATTQLRDILEDIQDEINKYLNRDG